MKSTLARYLVLAVLATGTAGSAIAADKKAPTTMGARIYNDSCALCHGPSGKGDGFGVEFLNRQPADLTVLSRKNGGVFPFERVYDVIDGRNLVKGHGSRDMPIWGNIFSEEKVKAAEYYVDVAYDMELYTRSRILAVIDYLHRIQAK